MSSCFLHARLDHAGPAPPASLILPFLWFYLLLLHFFISNIIWRYELYENYQRTVHNDPPWQITRGGFTSFLCKSPLESTTTPSGMRLGSYHQCYRVDGRLVAMGVLDLLPHCVSGVYFMYHEDYRAWGFGKLSACREAALAREGGYQYYYMGI